MLDTIQTELNQGVRKMAENSLIKKLNAQEINRSDLTDNKFEELLNLEMDIIKNDGKKVGAAWQIKKEISNEIAQSIHEVRQEQRQLALDEKIKVLTLPNKNHNLEKK